MIIKKDHKMILFRFRNYKNYNFISEHKKIINTKGSVWFLKVGKRTDINKISQIISDDGWMVLQAPKAMNSETYIAKLINISESEPKADYYPSYYEEILDDTSEEFYEFMPAYQWFQLTNITKLGPEDAQKLVLISNNKLVSDVIKTTRTAVMFVKNTEAIDIDI